MHTLDLSLTEDMSSLGQSRAPVVVVVVVVVVVKRYLLGQGLLCVAHLYELDRESLAAAASGYKGTPSWLCYRRLCYGCCVSQQRDYVMAAVPARRE